MKIRTIEKELILIEESHHADVYMLASDIFHGTIKPWLIQKKYKFYAGMGTWLITNQTGKGIYFDLEDNICLKDKEIIDILKMDVVGFNQELGSLMPEFPNSRS